MRKRFISLAMSFIMAVSIVPSLAFTSFAETTEEAQTEAVVQTVEEVPAEVVEEMPAETVEAPAEETIEAAPAENLSIADVFKTGTNLAITSDAIGSADNFNKWQQSIKSENSDICTPAKMIVCGNNMSYDPTTYMPLDVAGCVKAYGAVTKFTDENFGKNSGIYACGSFEHPDGGDELNALFKKVPGLLETGWAVNPGITENAYGVYCLGAKVTYYNSTYTEEDINDLDKALSQVNTIQKPIFIAASAPLHLNPTMMIETTNAQKLINVLNKYSNIIFLWGDNNGNNDPLSGCVVQPGGNLTIANGRSKNISFAYASAGKLSDTLVYEGWTPKQVPSKYAGLIANMNTEKINLQYLDTAGQAASELIEIDFTQKPAPVSDEVIRIENPWSWYQYSMTIQQGEIFTIEVVGNTPNAFTATSGNTSIAIVNKVENEPEQNSEKVLAGNSAKFTVTGGTSPGNTYITINMNNFYYATVAVTVLDEQGNPVNPEGVIIPTVNNPTENPSIDVGQDKQYTVMLNSMYAMMGMPTTVSNSNEDVVKVTDKDGKDIKNITPEYGSYSKDIKIQGLKEGKSTIIISNGFESATIKVTVGNATQTGTKKYLAIGDSIGAGVKGGGTNSAEYTAYSSYDEKGNKNWDINAVPYSYVSLFANSINADPDNSWNGTAAGFRAKEICNMLDLPAYDKEEAYNYNLESVTWEDLETVDYDVTKLNLDDYYGWSMGSQLKWSKMFTVQNKKVYKKAVAGAEVITIELGANEFNAFAMYGPLLNRILPAVQDAIEKTQSITDPTKRKKVKAAYTKLVDMMKNIGKVGSEDVNELFKLLREASTIVKDLRDLGVSYDELLDSITESFDYAYKSYRYYWETLLKEIRRVNKKAVIVVTTVPNPVKGMQVDLGGIAANGADLGGMDISKLVEPFINDMNNFIRSKAKTYNYSVADISEVSLNPTMEDPETKQQIPNPEYRYHPDNEGHQILFKAVKATYDKAISTSGGGAGGIVIAAIVAAVAAVTVSVVAIVSKIFSMNR